MKKFFEKILVRLLEKVTQYLPENRISFNGDVYLRRFYLFGHMSDALADHFRYGPPMKVRFNWWKRTVYLHCFYRPDRDRNLHNHPWAGRSFILTGGYLEERYIGHPAEEGAYKTLISYSAGNLNRLDADTYHRVKELYEPQVWTMFVIGKKVQSWGFWVEEEGRHVNHREYNDSGKGGGQY